MRTFSISQRVLQCELTCSSQRKHHRCQVRTQGVRNAVLPEGRHSHVGPDPQAMRTNVAIHRRKDRSLYAENHVCVIQFEQLIVGNRAGDRRRQFCEPDRIRAEPC